MSHKHAHCAHTHLAYCTLCQVVYCHDCRQEWTAKPAWPWTYTYTSPWTYGTTIETYTNAGGVDANTGHVSTAHTKGQCHHE